MVQNCKSFPYTVKKHPYLGNIVETCHTFDEHRTISSELCVIIRTTRSLSFPDADLYFCPLNASNNYQPTASSSRSSRQKKKISNLGPFLKLLKFHHLKPLVLSKGNPKGTVQMLAPSIPSNQKKLLGCPIEVSKSLVSGL